MKLLGMLSSCGFTKNDIWLLSYVLQSLYHDGFLTRIWAMTSMLTMPHPLSHQTME